MRRLVGTVSKFHYVTYIVCYSVLAYMIEIMFYKCARILA
jgi:hypothetical protein